jgi:hypothetical protein
VSAYHTTDRGVIHRARAEDVYGRLEAGSVSLVIGDGPYFLGKADWDRFPSWDAFRDWYRPHVQAWDRVCAGAATVYMAGTDESASALRPLMADEGWTWRVRVTWDKGIGFMAGKCDLNGLTRWYDTTEVFDVYTRDTLTPPTGPATTVQHAAGSDERNWIRHWLRSEWFDSAGLSMAQAREALGVAHNSGLPSHYFSASQWALPTWERYQQLAAYASEHGAPRDRPYLVHPDVADLRATFDHLREEFDHLREEFDHLREEYEAMRVPFNCPPGVGNVWRHPQVAGRERLRGPDGKALHPCQKPIAFYDRIIRASSRPGDLVLEPFAGTCRAAVACEALPHDEARRYVCIEPDEDGRDYLPAVVESMQAQAPTLFQAAK